MKIEKLLNLLEQAQVVAKNSHDSETQVGTLLFHPENGIIAGQGFNGHIRKAPDKLLPSKRPEKHLTVIHSEHNSILNCSRLGIKTDGLHAMCTHSPCVWCRRYLWQSGIDTIYFGIRYKDLDETLTMPDLNVIVEEIESGLYKMKLEEKCL